MKRNLTLSLEQQTIKAIVVILDAGNIFLQIYWRLVLIIAIIAICFFGANYCSQKYDIRFRIGPGFSTVNDYFKYDSQNRVVSHIILSGDKISDKYLYKYNDDLTSCLHYVYDSDENIIEVYESIEDDAGYILYSRHSRGGEVVNEEFYAGDVQDGKHGLRSTAEEAD